MSDEQNGRWVFECQNCGEVWVDPEAPVSGHYCDWHGRGMPPEDATEYDVKCTKAPDSTRGSEP